MDHNGIREQHRETHMDLTKTSSAENLVTLAQPYAEPTPQTPMSPTTIRFPAVVIATIGRGQSCNRTLHLQVCDKIGDASIISHSLHRLETAGFEDVIVVIGQNGDAIRAAVQLDGCVNVKFLDLGFDFKGTYTDSVLAAREHLQAGSDFVLMTADTIYDPSMLSGIASRDADLSDGDKCRVLVENDIQGMVGITSNFLLTATRPFDSPERICQCAISLPVYSGISCSLYRCPYTMLADLEDIANRIKYKDPFEEILQSYACLGKLVSLNTDGRTWFCVESATAAEFAQQTLTKIGNTATSDGGSTLSLTGHPKVQQRASDGGDWAEFDVGKWRNAVFKAQAYHAKLYDDTSKFVIDCASGIGGASRCAVVEVGCGTGEAILGEVNGAFKYTVGMDFNQRFIDFCNEQKTGENTMFLTGDACGLGDLLAENCPDWMQHNKIVMCVGNTIGIMPDEIKETVYKEMAEVAGETGLAVIVFWNGNKFGDAVQHFYFANPQLCGEFSGEHIDLDSCTLRCPSGYTTHWTKPEEARMIIEGYGLEVVALEESSDKVGVLTAFRKRR